MHTQLPLAVCFAALATAAAASQAQVTVDQILAIAPNSSTCDNPPAVGECATAEDGTPAINESFDTYNVTSLAEQAALIALMAFETLEFKYNHNHFPGVAGQGSEFHLFPSGEYLGR